MDYSIFLCVNMLTMHSQQEVPSYSNGPSVTVITIVMLPFSQPGQASRPMRQPYAGSETAAVPHVTKKWHRLFVLRNACSHNHLLQGVGCCYYICSDMFFPITLCFLRSKNQTTALFAHKSDDKRCWYNTSPGCSVFRCKSFVFSLQQLPSSPFSFFPNTVDKAKPYKAFPKGLRAFFLQKMFG